MTIQTPEADIIDAPARQAKARADKAQGKTPAPKVVPDSGHPASCAATVRHWLTLSRDELDKIYKSAKPGDLPQGDTRGTAILAGSRLSKPFAALARLGFWQGKVFDLFAPDFKQGVVVNKVAPFGLNLIVAKTYRDVSWMDGKETLVIDYSKTSLLARQIRDEIRQVKPGLYLGKVWWGKHRILDFALETSASAEH